MPPLQVRIAKDYVPHTAQRLAHQSKHRFRVLSAGVRAGKTRGGAVDFIERIYRDIAAGRVNTLPQVVTVGGKRRRPRYHAWVVAPTIPLLREPMRYIFEIVPPELIDKWYESESALWLHPDILIEFKGAENERSLVSVGLNSMWIDEAARVKALSWRSALRSRLSNPVKGTDEGGWCVFTTSPMGQGNWVFTDLISRGQRIKLEDGSNGRLTPVTTHDGGDPEILTVEWTTAQNPHYPRKDLEAARRQLPWRFFKRDYLASWDSMTGNIFEEWDPVIHTFTTQPHPSVFKQIIMAMDFGWTAPGCLLVIGDLGGRFMTVEEVYKSHHIFCDPRMEEQAGPIVVDKPRPTWVGDALRMVQKWAGGRRSVQVFYDPAEPDKGHDLRRFGLFATPAKNDILYGVRRVAETLHPVDNIPALKIWKGCTNLVREVPLYAYGQDRNGNPTEFPASGQSDHAIDPLRYGTVELTEYADLLAKGANDPDTPGAAVLVRDEVLMTNRERVMRRRGLRA